MRYLCTKQLSAGGAVYHPGEIIPDGAILPGRSGKLIRSGHISEIDLEAKQEPVSSQGKLFTEKEVEAMVADATAEAEKGNEERIAELQGYVAGLQEAEPVVYVGTVPVSVKSAADVENERIMVVAKPEEIQQVFSILQMNAEEAAKAIAEVESENALVLLHAADSRITVKNAAKKRADNLFSINGGKNGAGGGKPSTEGSIQDGDAAMQGGEA